MPVTTIVDNNQVPLGTVTNPLAVSGGGSAAIATAAAPSYSEGATEDLSMDLHGGLRALLMSAAGAALVTAPTASAVTSVAGSASSVTILASNSARLGFSVYNDSSAILYLKANSGAASSSSYTSQVPAGGYFEDPYGYTGEITGIWASATGNARVTEYS